MRSVILGLVMITVFAGASFAQEPPRVQLAVENCTVNPGESPAMSQAEVAETSEATAQPQAAPQASDNEAQSAAAEPAPPAEPTEAGSSEEAPVAEPAGLPGHGCHVVDREADQRMLGA